MALQTQIISADGSKNHHRFTLTTREDSTSTIENKSYLSFSFEMSLIKSGSGWNFYDFGNYVKYKITINGTNYTGSIDRYDLEAVKTIRTEANIPITHNTDGTKTINISFEVTDTSGSNLTPGNASASTTMKLADLHKPPVLTLTGLEEQTKSWSTISDTLFVRYVSRKKFTVSYSFYDSATASDIKIYSKSGIEISKLTTTLNASQGNFVISNFDIKDDDVTNGKTSFIIELTDSLGGVTRITTPEYNVTLYNNPNIVKTSSYAKRNGQTTKQAKITLVGTWFNGKIGTADNSLTIKFDYWKVGDSEPDFMNYRYTIPMQGTGNNIDISDWILKNGNNILKVFEKENSYYVGVIVADGKTGLVQTLKFLLPKGEWLMAKFKDRVDFLNITVGGNKVVDSGTNYIKYYDGTMICWDSSTTATLSWAQDASIWYVRGLTLPDFAETFISPPIVTKTIQSMSTPGRHINICGNSAPTTTNPGTYNLDTYWNATGTTVTVTYIAIGKWK